MSAPEEAAASGRSGLEPGRLAGVRAVVTRAAGGIGAGIRRRLADEGARVFRATMQQQAIQEHVTPEHFAGPVAFLASPGGRLITGQTIVCDGGGLLH